MSGKGWRMESLKLLHKDEDGLLPIREHSCTQAYGYNYYIVLVGFPMMVKRGWPGVALVGNGIMVLVRKSHLHTCI